MVQLKHPSAFSCIGLENFNSIMVQLKQDAGSGRFVLEEFQFQYGTIKTQLVNRPLFSIRHFNSIMVQLKQIRNYQVMS